MAFTIVIDGPNFINMLHDLGKDCKEIIDNFSFEDFRNAIQRELRNRGLYSHPFLHAEFIYSNKPRIGDFEGNEKELLIDKIGNSTGFIPRKIELTEEGQREKGVDHAVFAKMVDVALNSFLSKDPQHVVLISRDKDYVPDLQLLRRIGIHTIVIGPRHYTDRHDKREKEYPKELINESYLFVDLKDVLDEIEQVSGDNSK